MIRSLLLFAALVLASGLAPGADARLRTGKEVVDSICASCHQAGKDGAPKIGDKDAWIPRMKRGLNELTIAAIRGHGGMPARGGHAELMDAEVRSAITYMFDPGAEARAAARPAPPPAPARGPNEMTVNGIEVHFGLVPAERMRKYPRDSTEAQMHGGVPSGSGYQHVNVTLFNAANRAALPGAAVEVEVVQAGAALQRKSLEAMRNQDASSYGQYVRLTPKVPATFTVRIRLAGSDRTSEARFTPTPE